MSIWDRLTDLVRGPRNDARPLSTAQRGDSFWDVFFDGPGGLPVLNERTALMVSAIYACVSLIAGAISALPLHIYRQSPDGERDRLPGDDLWWVLNEQMSPRWSAPVGWEAFVLSLLLGGDGFARIDRNLSGAIIGLTPIHWSRVTVYVTSDGRHLVYRVQPEPGQLGPAVDELIEQSDMLHVPGFGFDGKRGLSPLRVALRMTGSVASATQDFSAQFFVNGARPDYVLKSANKLSPETIESLREQIAERHGGQNRHRPMILSSGLEPHTLSLPLEELQLLQTRQFQVEEIARIYGVPPFMIGHTTSTTSWGSGVEAMGKTFVRYTLNRHLNRIMAEVNRKFFKTAARVAVFDTAELERGDLKSLFEAMRIAMGRAGEPGFMSTYEVRKFLNLKREPDGPLNPGAGNAQPTATPAGG